MTKRRRRSWRDHVYTLRWFAGPLPEPRPAEGHAWRRLSREETEAWAQNRDADPETRETFRVAVENGHALLVAEIDGLVVARRFVGTGWVYIGEPIWSRVQFPQGMAYFYGMYVEPAHRGRGIGKAGVASGLAYARAAGLSSCALWIRRYNAPSLRNWRELGVPWFDTTRLVVSHRGLWIPRSPWPRLGVTSVVGHLPRRDAVAPHPGG